MLCVTAALVTVCLALPDHKKHKHGHHYGKRSAENGNGNNGSNDNGTGSNGSNGSNMNSNNGSDDNSSSEMGNNGSNGNGNDDSNDNGNDDFNDDGNITSEDYDDEDFIINNGDSNGASDAKVLMAVVDIPEATEVLDGILECLDAMDTPVMVLQPLGNMTMSMTRNARRLERKRGRW